MISCVNKYLILPSKSKVHRVISSGTCCLEGWSGHGSRNMESQHKSNGLRTRGL
uniref:Uncharacterized protein n=1 Tax=Helianthus annuus TaxID=4232 RepID=A0A251SBS8_HELAN